MRPRARILIVLIVAMAWVGSYGQGAAAPPPSPLTLQAAETLALQNNPQVTVARLVALASKQVVRETRSAYWPQAAVNLTGVDAQDNSRISAGGLNNPIIFPRAAAGTIVSQLITDFGRTRNLVASSNLRAKAEQQNALATAEQIKLAVDQAFYAALQSQAVLQVANQTVQSRQTVVDQIQALFQSKLKSSLDLSFANVNLAQAKLLLLDAQNNSNAALADLSAALGYSNLQNLRLADDSAPLPRVPGSADQFIVEAMQKRPELAALNYNYQSAEKFRVAERDLVLPSVRALGAVGSTPLAGATELAPWYGAVGADIEIPVFNGFLFSARAKEAQLRAQASKEQLRNLQDTIARDVRNGWLNATTAYQRVDVSRQLLHQANLSLDLAQTRYKLGLGSIVELSQAQLQQTQAEIGNAQATYDYKLALRALQFQVGNL